MGKPSEHLCSVRKRPKGRKTMRETKSGHPRVNRRDFVAGAAAMGAGALGLPWRSAQAAEIPNEFDGSKFQLSAPEPNPKSGGVLRMGIPTRAPHFDLHQSGTFLNLRSMGCTFDNLIRRDPRDSG